MNIHAAGLEPTTSNSSTGWTPGLNCTLKYVCQKSYMKVKTRKNWITGNYEKDGKLRVDREYRKSSLNLKQYPYA